MKNLSVLLFVLAASICSAQNPHAMSNGDMQWGPAPAMLPKGAKMAVLQGNPAQGGVFTIRAKMPNGYTVPPHWHSTDEMVTVISGHIYMGMGDKIDLKHAQLVGPGGFMAVPAKSHHYVRAKGPVIIQVHAMAPFDITYINPKDDPRKH